MGAPLPVHPSPQMFFDDPVDLQVRIPSDGRCEMGIIPGRQPEMSRIFRRIFRLLHGPQNKPADHGLTGRPLDPVQKFLHFLRFHFIPDVEMIAEIIDKCGELADLLVVRHVVRPVKERDLQPEIRLRHRLICHQHKIFNDLRGVIAFIGLHLDRAPQFIKRDLRLREIKIHGSSPSPALPDLVCKLLHQAEHGHVLCIVRIFYAVFPLRLSRKHRRHAVVTHPFVHADHRLRDLMFNDLAPGIDRHNAGKGQPVLPGVQGADPV